MASIVDEFAGDGATQDRLYMLLWDMKIGERSDWYMPAYNHIVSQICGAFLIERQSFPKWYDELGDLLVDLQVESMMPGDRTDSLGDMWAKSHTWKRKDAA